MSNARETDYNIDSYKYDTGFREVLLQILTLNVVCFNSKKQAENQKHFAKNKHTHIYQSINLSIYQSINLSIYLSITQSIVLSIYPSINLSNLSNLSIYQSINLSIYLYIYMYIYRERERERAPSCSADRASIRRASCAPATNKDMIRSQNIVPWHQFGREVV